MTKMAVYQEANVILGSSLSPNNYCICKSTAIANGADVEKINTIVVNAANNRLLPVSALQPTVVTYTIRFLDWDGTVLKTESVPAGVTPTPPTVTKPGWIFSNWYPALYPANKDEVYTASWNEAGGGGDDPSNPYQVYCNGVASGGIVYVDVHTTSVDISWSGPTPKDSQWYVTGSGSGGGQAGYHSWGSGYVNNLNFTNTTTIQEGGYVSYSVYGIHPESGGSASTSGSWDIRVVESH